MPSRPPGLKPARQRKPWAKRSTFGRMTGRKAVEQRKRRLAAEPLCRMCKAKGIVRAADEWDHVLPLSQGGLDTDENGQPICRDCHRAKTASEAQRGRRGLGRPGGGSNL